MRGRWAQGLEPRGFTWIIKERLAASERPGGFARNHRKVRRQEELIWLAGNGFTHVLSLLESPHNLHAYDEAEIAYEHLPLGRRDEWPGRLPGIYQTLKGWLDDPAERVLIHHEEFGERLLGVLAGYLQGPPREINAFQADRLPILAAIVERKPITAERGPSECWPVMRIARDRLLHQT